MVSILWWTSVAACSLVARLIGVMFGRPESRGALIGRTVAELFQRLGPTYIKLGQLLGSRHDLLTDAVARELQCLRDDLPPIAPSTARAMLSSELGGRAVTAFAEIADVPVANGSIASVYRARLADRTSVAVKIQRPGIGPRIDRDLRLLHRLARAAERVPALRVIPFVAVIDDLGQCLRQQLDFVREAETNRFLRRALHDQRSVVIPRLIDDLCTPAMLTMEFIEEFAHPIVRRGDSDKRAVRAALHSLYQMIFVEGVVHCDMHEGNLRLLPDGRVAIVDFGFVARLEQETRLSFAEFFLAMASGDGWWCADIALKLAGGFPRTLDRAAFARDIGAVVAQAAGRRVADFNVARFVAQLFGVQRRHRVRGTPAFVMSVVALLVLEALAKVIDKDLDFQREAMPYIARARIWASGTRAGNVESVKRRFSRAVTPLGC